MTRAIDLTWAGGEHRFFLSIELLRALQDKTDCGPAWCLARLGSNQYYVDDIVSTIRLGLEGGGLTKERAHKLVKMFVEERPLAESLKTAQLVLMSALYSTDEEDVPGESPAE